MKTYRIILADDHAMLREGIKKIINETKGMEVVGEASDGLGLLNMLKHTVPDMVLLDVSMPNIRGIEAANEIRQMHPQVAILFLSMYKKKEYLHLALNAGAKGYLLKEDTGSELIRAINTIRNGGTYLSPLMMKELPAELIAICRGNSRLEEDPLTPRERQVLALIADGNTSREIGELLFISIHTVQNHRKNIKKKLSIQTSADLVRYAVRHGYTG